MNHIMFRSYLKEYSSDASFQLYDEDSKFLTVPSADADHSYEGDEPYKETASKSFGEERNKVELLRQSVTDVTRGRDKLREELEATRQQLKLKKARVKELWRMSCEQIAQHDAMIISKDKEIARLRAQLAERVCQRNPTSPDAGSLLVSDVAQPGEARCGRAPPIDTFTGEDSAVRLDDWLPGLEGVAHWNGWTSDEKVIQLAGHLRGCAEAEWNLLGTEETHNYDTTIQNLRERLDPCNKVLAGQDFRRTMQGDSETVADYVCRLEKAFHVAFGSDGLSRETKEAQEGLRLGIIRNPSVSGALNYKGLCMAAKHKEQRQAEIRKRQEYGKSQSRSQGRSRVDDWTSERPIRQNINNSGLSGSGSVSSAPTNKCCYVCNQVGQFAKNCKTNSKEQESQITSGQKKDPSKGNTRQVTTESSNDQLSASEASNGDPLPFLYSDSDGTVDTVRVSDKGSKPQYVNVQVQGVPTSGILDTGADTTIMGGELFKKIAVAAKLRKKASKKQIVFPILMMENSLSFMEGWI